MRIFNKTIIREYVDCSSDVMDWKEEGFTIRWRLFNFTIFKKSYIHPFCEKI